MKYSNICRLFVIFFMAFFMATDVCSQNIILCKTIKTNVCKTIGIQDAKERSRFVDSLLSASLLQGKGQFLEVMTIADTYLADPNSPYRNEEAYIPFLEYAVRSKKLNETEKTRYHYQLRMAYKNRVGTRGADFSYITRDGLKGRLSKLKGKYVLLYFNNPECHDCNRVFGYLSASKVIHDMLAAGTLTLLALYPDEDLGAWERHKDEYPKVWLAARYASPEEREVYHLPAIPCLYLLDAHRKVLLKDAPVGRVEDFLLDEIYVRRR